MKDSTAGFLVGAAGLALSLGVYFWSVNKAAAQTPVNGLGYRSYYTPPKGVFCPKGYSWRPHARACVPNNVF